MAKARDFERIGSRATNRVDASLAPLRKGFQ